MSRPLRIEISERLFALIAKQAAEEGTQPETLAQRAVEKEYSFQAELSQSERDVAQARFERHFGTWDIGRPIGSDNEQIDADLAAEYARGLPQS